METLPVLDRSKLARLEELGGADLIRKITEMFLDNAPGRLEVLLRGDSARTLEEVAFAAHALKSSAGNVGLRELQFLCGELEQAANAGDAAACQGLVSRLLVSYGNSCAALRAQGRKAEE